jgi:hypothetical protein
MDDVLQKGFSDSIEKAVRDKCKVGDVITFYGDQTFARLCDLNKPFAALNLGGVCILTQPRKRY